VYGQYKLLTFFAALSLCKKMYVYNEKSQQCMMNIGQWSAVCYSPVNLDLGLKEWVEKPVIEKFL
jgi:hypothetical protein